MTYAVIVQRAIPNGDTANPFISVYTYQTDVLLPTSVEAQALADAFWDFWVAPNPGWGLAVHTTMVTNRVEVTFPYAPDALGIHVGTEAGLQGGDPTNRFVAVEFKQERQRADMRAGFKRFGYLTEATLTAGQPISTYLTQLNTLAGMLSERLDFTNGLDEFHAVPIIVKRIPYTAPSGNTAYRLPSGMDAFTSYNAQSWAYSRITTQNSRKG